MWMTANTSFNWYVSDGGLKMEQFGTAPLPAGPKTSAAQIGGGYWTLNPASSPEKQAAAWTYVTWRVHPDTWKFVLEDGERPRHHPGAVDPGLWRLPEAIRIPGRA